MKTLLKATVLALVLAPSGVMASGYVGVSAGYFFDGQDPAIATQFGTAFSQSGKTTHCVELELLWTQASEGPVSLDVVPLTANYKFIRELSPKMSLEFGGGLGVAFNQLNVYGTSDDDTAFAFQFKGGLTFKLGQSSSLYLGAKYLNIGEATMAGFTAEVGDDVAAELGIRFGF